MLDSIKGALTDEEFVKCYTLLAKTYWKKGKDYTTGKEAQMATFELGRAVLDAAQEKLSGKKIERDSYAAECRVFQFLYWMALLHGEYGSAKGIMESLSLVGPIKNLCNAVIKLNPNYEDGGAYLVLGRMYYKLPGLFGGSNDESIKDLLLCRAEMEKKSPEDRSHTVYKFLAETYMSDKEYAKAKEALEIGLKTPKNKDNPKEDDAGYKEMEDLLVKAKSKL